ncbi:helix-turn-helix domain-containing protein [Streptomyces sp. NBC_01285]|uniref:helix-turn-helix domain-containing protein n=1 Tax=Streptomyces sp. NBC_01285 TaxID=2903813 RepID=UPI002252748B|nr:helix-turn-helix domain-containing protein [Streptomyces sp. NBC_01285]MCX4773783.1 helix-turn-helix domain-containing protein [Streptomyces sp. NBC_01285]
MNAYAMPVFAGARLFFGGDVVEVVEVEGLQTTVRNERTGEYSSVPLGRLAAGARSIESPAPAAADGVGMLLASLSAGQRQRLAERAGHVREVLSGYRSGHPGSALPTEPRTSYDPDLSLKDRTSAKAAELGVTARTLERWLTAYRQSGEAGLVDARAGRISSVDPRWEEAVRRVMAESVTGSTPTRSALLLRAEERLNAEYGKGTVPVPGRSTAYARLAWMAKGTNAVSGSAKARRSIAERPQGTYGRLRATRPGEYVVLDTQDLDIYAMEPVTCRWVPLQLTVAQDLFSRCIVGLRVTACSTKAVDVAGVLFEAVCPPLEDAARPALAPYHGLWDEVVFAEDGLVPGGGLCPPETLVIDHGRAFMSAHVMGVCTRLGMSIQPAQPKKPTDKPTVERFFRTLREGLIQHLPAYKGPDVHSRGHAVEDAAFFFIHEVEEIVREWITEVYHRREHDGLVIPQWPKLSLSPLEMLRIGLARAGRLRMPASPELAFQFLAVKPRTIQHYGVEVDGLRYNGAVLDGYRNAPSPYAGLGRQWPIHVNPDDVRFVYFQDPADDSWHPLLWEHAPALTMAFSGEAATYARRLAAREGRHIDTSQALAALLTRWDQGMVTDRRERRMAVRLSAERGALSLPLLREQSGPLTPPELKLVPELPAGDSDEEDELFDAPEGDDFYADAFEVIE